MAAYLYRMPAGIPGTVNRQQEATITQELMDSAAPVTTFGVPVKMVASKIQAIGAGDTSASIFGLLVKPAISQGLINEPIGTATPRTSGICNILKRGFMEVMLGGATAATKNGVVYVRIATASTGKPIGGVEAAADGANTIIMTGAYFMGPADAAGNCEIAYNL